jgi:hypothetical protein
MAQRPEFQLGVHGRAPDGTRSYNDREMNETDGTELPTLAASRYTKPRESVHGTVAEPNSEREKLKKEIDKLNREIHWGSISDSSWVTLRNDNHKSATKLSN